MSSFNEGDHESLSREDVLVLAVTDVAVLVKSLGASQGESDRIADQAVDGEALLELTAEHLMKPPYEMRGGPAMKVAKFIKKQSVGTGQSCDTCGGMFADVETHKATHHQGSPPASSLREDPFDRFVALLKKGGRFPQRDVLDKCRVVAAYQVLLANTPHSAMTIYDRVRLMAGSTTRAKVEGAAAVKLNGPAFDNPKILSGVDEVSHNYVLVKILRECSDSANMSLTEVVQELRNEVAVVEALHLDDDWKARDMCMVHTKVVTVTVPPEDASAGSPGSFSALLMPHYVATATNGPARSEEACLCKGKMIERALTAIHLAGWVHMDVKSDNVFCDMDGDWFLGDFGSCKLIGDPIGSYTEIFYPRPLRREPAHPAYDWYMLVVMLLFQLNKGHWKQLLCGEGYRVVHNNIVSAVQSCGEELQSYLKELLERANFSEASFDTGTLEREIKECEAQLASLRETNASKENIASTQERLDSLYSRFFQGQNR